MGVGGVGGANRVGFLLHFLPFHLTLRPHIILAETLLFDHYRKDARLPEQLQRAMAAEAEASREARAKVIAADGEKRASKALREASNVIEQSPSALQLRYLQVCIYNIDESILFCLSYHPPPHSKVPHAVVERANIVLGPSFCQSKILLSAAAPF